MIKKINVLDTFAGAGGFSLGFKQSGYNIIGAIEKDLWASETYSYNHKGVNVITKEIETVTDEEIKSNFTNVQVILGGPPCQGFSICNKNSGDPKDPRNSLFKELIRVSNLIKPQIIIMENVPNLIKAKTSDNEFVLDIIIKSFKEIGYNVYHTILDATNYGVPQIRKRLFVIATKQELSIPFPKPTHSLINDKLMKTPTLWDAISDLPQINAREGQEESIYTLKPQNEYQLTLRKNNSVLYNHVSMKHSKRIIERFSQMSWGDSVSDVPQHLKPQKRNGNGEISEKTYDQNSRRLHPNKPCHTIPASFYANFVHPYLNRNFTAREGARIQSFPDDYVFKGKPTVVSKKLLQKEERHDDNYLCQYNQIGNAVPPLLSQAIAEHLIKEYFNVYSW